MAHLWLAATIWEVPNRCASAWLLNRMRSDHGTRSFAVAKKLFLVHNDRDAATATAVSLHAHVQANLPCLGVRDAPKHSVTQTRPQLALL